MRKLEVATPLDTAAAELGFLVSPDEDEIRGTVRGVAVSAKWVTRGKSSDTNITVDSGGTIPRTLALGPESILSKLRIAAGRGDVFTGDQAFDRAIRVLGDETMAVAWLDDGTRRMFQAQAGSLEVQNGVLTIERSGALGGPSLVEAVGSTVQLAERLTLRKDDVPGRLQLKVGHEPPAAARRALELLQLRFPDHPAAREAIQTALTSPVPELRLAAACYLGEQGLVHVRELVVSKAVPVDLRLEGLVHYGLAAPVPEALVLIDRVGGPLAEAELPAEVAERLANVHDAAREPVLLRLLARAPQSASMSVLIAAVRGLGRIGAATAVEPLLAYRDAERNGEVRRAAQHAIAQIQARLGDAEAGRLSVAALTAMGGRLTVADPAPAGGISLATESSATTTPLG
jgi:hypothetical protein